MKPFRVVLRLVPGLFYVKYLERKNVLRVPRLFARTRIHAPNREHYSYTRVLTMEHVEHVEQRMFSIDWSVPGLFKTWNRHRTG